MKLDLLTNATVVDDAIRFVSSNKANENVKSSSESDKEESNQPDYDEDKDQLEEQEEGTGETADITITSFLIDYGLM
jgi:hypothetical protein